VKGFVFMAQAAAKKPAAKPAAANPRSGRPLLRYQPAAEYLGFTEQHLRRLKVEGRIPYVKLADCKSGPVFFDPDALDAWIEEHSHAATA
jgi:hypothetical protein